MKFRMCSTRVGAFALALVWVNASMESRAAEKTDPQLSRKEAKQLLRQASSPLAYQRLSAYFKQKEQVLEAKARKHEGEAEDYASGRKYQPKVPYPGGMVLHCRWLASEYLLGAHKAQARSSEYQALADRYRGNTVRP